ncbi:fungal-specific transcription factor domain-containing protein [Trichoderma sp. SZMC 28013]
MKRAVGPLDKRKRVTRCQACAKRQIKCQGGVPCEYCQRTKKICTPQAVSSTTAPTTVNVKFVKYTPPQQSILETATLPLQIQIHSNDLYLSSFTASLLRCQFTRDFTDIAQDLLPLMQTSPPLRNLAIALGALDASRRSSSRSITQKESPQCVAYHSYNRSLQSLQQRLQTSDAAVCEDVAWSTFLLGLFELMSESSGEGWAKHMFYGTSKVLQLAGPDAYASSLQQRLLNAFRVLEANRTILFRDVTFLSESKWSVYDSMNHKAAEIPDCMTSIIELMVQTSAFSKRLFEQIEGIPEEGRLFSPTITALAREGTELNHKISNWCDSVSLQSDPADPFNQLALANHHAVRLFHCRNFTYYTCWHPGTIPQLNQMEIDTCVAAIIYLCDKILQSSNIPGAILLFPLRMAGAHSNSEWQRDNVRNLLNQIYNSGFVVAERIQIDLVEFWDFQDGQDSIKLGV